MSPFFLLLGKDRAIEAVARKAKGIVAIVFVGSVARLRATVLPVGPVARNSVPVTQDLTLVLLGALLVRLGPEKGAFALRIQVALGTIIRDNWGYRAPRKRPVVRGRLRVCLNDVHNVAPKQGLIADALVLIALAPKLPGYHWDGAPGYGVLAFKHLAGFPQVWHVQTQPGHGAVPKHLVNRGIASDPLLDFIGRAAGTKQGRVVL